MFNHPSLKSIFKFIILSCGFFLTYSLEALTFHLPAQGNVVGALQTVQVKHGESLADVGRRFDIGVYEMIEANPELDPWAPMAGAMVVIPSQFILPTEERKGIVLNLAEMRLYYYHSNQREVSTFPVAIGKKGWATPIGATQVLRKEKDPSWYPPASIREEHLKKDGEDLPEVIPAGPDNPLGKYKMQLALPGYLIHGTNRPGGIGIRTSHGCIRLAPADIEALFNMVEVGTPVKIIHEPFKIGHLGDTFYLEAHQPLSELREAPAKLMAHLSRVLTHSTLKQGLEINWPEVEHMARQFLGYPVAITTPKTMTPSF